MKMYALKNILSTTSNSILLLKMNIKHQKRLFEEALKYQKENIQNDKDKEYVHKLDSNLCIELYLLVVFKLHLVALSFYTTNQ